MNHANCMLAAEWLAVEDKRNLFLGDELKWTA